MKFSKFNFSDMFPRGLVMMMPISLTLPMEFEINEFDLNWLKGTKLSLK